MSMFYIQNKETTKLEKKINYKINLFLNKIKENKLDKFIYSFGIIGPCSRGEGFYVNDEIRSDIDFYLISNKFSFKKQKEFRKIFNKIFEKELDCSLLFAAPTIHKKPDLMYFEYTNSGKILFGKKISPIKLEKISKFEAFRNIIYRSCYFLSLLRLKKNKLILKDNIDEKQFLYYYSKVIFSAGEVFLILDNKYIANNFKRNELIKNNKFSKQIKEFNKDHQSMHNFRYKNKIPKDFNIENYINKAFKINIETYNILFKNLISINKLNKLHPNFIRRIYYKTTFTIKFFITFKKINLYQEEDFIYLIKKYFLFIKKNKKNKDELNEILFYWKNANWFYKKL